MPIEERLVCNKCKRPVEKQPELGDKQGGLTRIEHGATTWEMVLCADCKKPLWELYRDYVELVLPRGTARAMDMLDYLPRQQDVAPKPPKFKG
jgi:uncharacterized protein with PIN domain